MALPPSVPLASPERATLTSGIRRRANYSHHSQHHREQASHGQGTPAPAALSPIHEPKPID